jgi:hypothetical protein
VVLCVALAVGGLGFRSAVRSLNVYLKKQPVPLREHFGNLPRHLPGWKMIAEGERLSAEMVEELGTELYLDRQYAREGDPDGAWLQLHIAYYTGMIDAVPHVPDRCLVAGGYNTRAQPDNIPMEVRGRGWMMPPPDAGPLEFPKVTILDTIARRPVDVHLPDGDYALRTTEFSHTDQPNSRTFAGYFFIANGRIAVTPEQVKAIAFRKSEEYAYYCKVQFFAVGDDSLTAERFVEHAASLLEVFLPELMRCLPDWPEVMAMAEGTEPPTTE